MGLSIRIVFRVNAKIIRWAAVGGSDHSFLPLYLSLYRPMPELPVDTLCGDGCSSRGEGNRPSWQPENHVLLIEAV